MLLIVVGFILDGQVSWRERRRIGELRGRGVFDYDAREVTALCADFVRGAGVERLLARQMAEAW